MFSFILSHVLTRGLPFRPLTHAVSVVDETLGTTTAELLDIDFNLSCALIIKSLMQAPHWGGGGFQKKLFNLDKANIKWQP